MSPPVRLRLRLAEPERQVVLGEVERASSADVAGRLWARDPTLWGPRGTPEVADRLGWLGAPEAAAREVDAWSAVGAGLAEEGVRDLVLLGMGGSSLAPEVIARAAPARPDRPRLTVLDSIHPRAVRAVLGATDPATTALLVSSKSGGTLETRSLDATFAAHGHPPERTLVVTDPGSGLEARARERGVRLLVAGEPTIGGRFSALSPFGLLPAALTGADAAGLAAAGVAAGRACREPDPGKNPGVLLGCVLGALRRAGRDKLHVVCDPPLEGFGTWLEQLVAESTGKDGTGVLPIADQPLVPARAHGDDRVVLWLTGSDGGAAQTASQVEALAAAGHPVLELAHDGLGAAFMVAEVAVAVLGWSLGVNAFDQPDVQAAKDATAAVLDEAAAAGAVPASAAPTGRAAALALLDGLGPPGYLAVLGWTPADPDVQRAAGELATAVQVRCGGAAVTFGVGPRYLHSTGQLHKGGPAGGRFLLLVDDDGTDVVPGDGATASLRTTMLAQALGDERALAARDRPLARLEVAGDPAGALRDLARAVADGA